MAMKVNILKVRFYIYVALYFGVGVVLAWFSFKTHGIGR